MINPLLSLLEMKNIVTQLYGLPGTYKTSFLVQLIHRKLEEGYDQIYLVDSGGNFPFIRFKSISPLLENLIVFQPKSLKEEAIILDDLSIQVLSQDSILVIDDVFRHTNLENKKNFHLNSYILALIKNISKTIDFPIIITNQARSFDDIIRPFLQSLTLQYFDLHFLFEKTQNPKKILISYFDHELFVSQREYTINSSGFLTEI